MNQPEPLNSEAQEIVAHKVRHAAGVQALRKIGDIVAEERQAEAQKAQVLGWAARYGWLVLIAVVVLLVKWTGVI